MHCRGTTAVHHMSRLQRDCTGAWWQHGAHNALGLKRSLAMRKRLQMLSFTHVFQEFQAGERPIGGERCRRQHTLESEMWCLQWELSFPACLPQNCPRAQRNLPKYFYRQTLCIPPCISVCSLHPLVSPGAYPAVLCVLHYTQNSFRACRKHASIKRSLVNTNHSRS